MTHGMTDGTASCRGMGASPMHLAAPAAVARKRLAAAICTGGAPVPRWTRIACIVTASCFMGAAGCASNKPAASPATMPAVATREPGYWFAEPGVVSVAADDFESLWRACEDAARHFGFGEPRRLAALGNHPAHDLLPTRRDPFRGAAEHPLSFPGRQPARHFERVLGRADRPLEVVVRRERHLPHHLAAERIDDRVQLPGADPFSADPVVEPLAHPVMPPLQVVSRRHCRAFKMAEIEARDEGSFELYDLENDPHELENLRASHPETVAALEERLRQWRTATAPAKASQAVSEDDARRLRALGYVQ